MAPDSKIRSTAEYDAAAQLINLKQWDRAIGVLEGFRRDYPKNELQADVGRKLAVAYTEAGRSGQAAAEFERIALDPKETKQVQREALLQSADLYAKANNTPKAVTMLEKFVATNPTPIAGCDGSASAAGGYRRQERRRREARQLVSRDRESGFDGRQPRARTARSIWRRKRSSLWRSRCATRSVACG